ncbi:MAG TPA: hypothetical protein PKE39_06725 [Ignavibacteria bacterium]|nr:hypothetical protein [Ignavibacteria bacterium]HMQ98703.1 hypothetical protein [Ignavibacteria bacterium]
MAKSFVIIIFIILSILLGCSSRKSDIKPDVSDSTESRIDVKENLPELEETFAHFDYNTVIKAKSRIIPDGMSITKFKYFVVFSDMNDELTFKLIDNDMRNTIDAMSNNYVNKLPDAVTPIFLFEKYENYKEFVMDNYDIPEDDISPYGFYKISKNVIVIRYVTWKGSILHEITHKFIRSDFPDAPSWFDEGFASLNEKSVFKDGNLTGEFSLRILPLRRAIKENTYTGLKHLMQTDDDELYGKRTSYYYAQSRYLLMYLQEKGLLQKYYKTFRDSYKKDKTGITQLEEITGKSLKTLDEELLDYIKSFKQ